MQQSCSIFHILLIIFVIFVTYKLIEHLFRRDKDRQKLRFRSKPNRSVILIEPDTDINKLRSSYGNGKNSQNNQTFIVSDMVPYNGYSTSCNFDNNDDENEHMESVGNNSVIPPQVMTEIMGSPDDLEIMSANGGNDNDGNFFELADAGAFPEILKQRQPFTTKYDDILINDTNKVSITSSNANTSNVMTNKLNVGSGSDQAGYCSSQYMMCGNSDSGLNYNDESDVNFAHASSNMKNLSYGGGKLFEGMTSDMKPNTCTKYVKEDADKIINDNCKKIGTAVNRMTGMNIMQQDEAMRVWNVVAPLCGQNVY